jgi:hypothetical protein
MIRLLAVALGVVLGVGIAAAPAAASVPSEVQQYVTDGSLAARLADVYGPDAAGNGIDFDDTTKPGAVLRVNVWTADQLAGVDTDRPIEPLNEWVVPISVADAPVGIATVWINPDTVEPELANFEADAEAAAALAEIPAGASLVRDEGGSAWLALGADDTVYPLVPGSTGLSTPVPLDEVALIPPPGPVNVVPNEPNTGLGLAIGVVVVLLIVIVVALIVPGRGRARREAVEAQPPDRTGTTPAD